MNKYLSRYFLYYPATYIKGERIYKLLKEKKENQWKSQEILYQDQMSRIRELFFYAKENSDYYRQLYSKIDLLSFEDGNSFNQVPPISKSVVSNNFKFMVTNYKERYESKTTGGSTGEPIRILKNSSALAHERAATWRAYEWAGISVGESQGRFWGVPHNQKDRLKAHFADLIANRKRVNAFNLTEKSLDQYYTKLKKFKPSYLYGYVSVIEALAKYIQDNHLTPFKNLKSIITTSEVLYNNSRDLIQNSFEVKIYNEYGCGEVGSIAHECEHGKMHIMADNLLLESSEEGELIVTDLHNFKMPLIRYRLGDFGEISFENCPCGRGLPILKHFFGRAYDFIQLKSGKVIHPEAIIYIFENFKKKHDVISQFQVVQTKISEIDVLIIPKEDWNNEKANLLVNLMLQHISKEIKFNIIEATILNREKSGKMRVVKSMVNQGLHSTVANIMT